MVSTQFVLTIWREQSLSMIMSNILIFCWDEHHIKCCRYYQKIEFYFNWFHFKLLYTPTGIYESSMISNRGFSLWDRLISSKGFLRGRWETWQQHDSRNTNLVESGSSPNSTTPENLRYRRHRYKWIYSCYVKTAILASHWMQRMLFFEVHFGCIPTSVCYATKA